MASYAKNLDYNPKFVEITDGSGIKYLAENVVGDLSDDQRYFYDITSAIITGIVPPSVMNKKIGSLNHSWWITLVSRVCRLYISNTRLTWKDKDNLKIIAHFIATNYSPLWFEIKCMPLYKDAPKHIFKAIQLFKLLSHDVLKPKVKNT